MNIAVILAGGIGSRLGASTPKQFCIIAGKTIIEHTVGNFEKNEHIDEIAIVIHPLYLSEIEKMASANHWEKVKKILPGGKERYASSLVAINAYSKYPEYNLLFHDAVRPMVSQRIINDTVEALKSFNAVDVAVDSTDTVIIIDNQKNIITDIPLRKTVRRSQTPQAFKLSTIKKAYRLALQDPDFVSTDDCGTVAKYLPQEKITVIAGEESNLKITYKEDLFLLERYLTLRETVD